jgi:hypothetical protein
MARSRSIARFEGTLAVVTLVVVAIAVALWM